MKFNLLDSIPELERGERIVAVKAVSLAEEYLILFSAGRDIWRDNRFSA